MKVIKFKNESGGCGGGGGEGKGRGHTLSISFQHLPPNSARFSYATEGALFISTQLSSDMVSALRRFGYTDKTVEAT